MRSPSPRARREAQDKYPSRPIQLIVPFPPGGPADVMGRLVAQHLSTALGQVIVENRPGAGGTLAGKAVATAEPDGYTLLLGSSAPLAIGPALYPNQRLRSAHQFRAGRDGLETCPT